MKMMRCSECQMSIPLLAKKCHHCLSPTSHVAFVNTKEETASPLNTALINGTAFWRLVGLSFYIPTLFSIILGIALWQIIPVVKASLGTNSIELTEGGAIKLKGSGKTNAVFLLSANGGDTSPWIDTGIEVKAGQILKFKASGHINLAAHRLVEYAERDQPPPSVWIGPQGESTEGEDNKRIKTPRPVDAYRNNYALALHVPRGRIIGRIGSANPQFPTKPLELSNDSDSTDFFDVWAKQNGYKVKTDGHLWLTINEIWLSKDNKNAFLPRGETPEENQKFDDYYIKWCTDAIFRDYAERLRNSRNTLEIENLKVKEEIIQKAQNAVFTGKSIDQADLAEAARIAREIKTSLWDSIISPSDQKLKSYPNLYFDDNAGAFSVTIEIDN